MQQNLEAQRQKPGYPVKKRRGSLGSQPYISKLNNFGQC